jgi:hypothetical protein
MGRSVARAATAIAMTAVLLLAASAVRAACIGDCPPSDGQVAVNELVLGVSIALGGAQLTTCLGYDANDNGAVGVEELIAAVSDALQGCPGASTPTPSVPITSTATLTPTVTWTPAPGPPITFFGVASADDSLQEPSGMDANHVPIYERPFGFGFILVVEAQGRFEAVEGHPGDTYNLDGLPDLLIQSARDLGNGSTSVCDVEPPNVGGVPGIDPPRLEDPAAMADAFNDFGCRFTNGSGGRTGRGCGEACLRFDDGEFHCQSEAADVQFCAPIDTLLEFPPGDTLLTVRARDLFGALGAPRQLIVRVP